MTGLTPPAVPAEPRKLGRYQLVELLGQGGMGEVWIAKLYGERGFEKPCLVKTVLPQLAKDRTFVQRFEHEAKVLTLLQHSNIAQVYDMGEAEGRLYMALEYITGVEVGQLEDSAKAQGMLLPVPVALFIGWQAAEGLGYAHRKTSLDGKPLDVVHRDVTPQNVMVSFEGEVKLIDFGIARSTQRDLSTQTSTVMGKLGYMSPEQALALEIDSRTDQYALAVLVWELLSGEPYIGEGPTAEVMQTMAYPTRRTLVGKRSDVDGPLDEALQKALSPRAADRYPTTDDFARALLQQLTRLGGPPSKAQVGQFVQQHCKAQLATSQRLLSKVSTFTAPTVPAINAVPPAASPAPDLQRTILALPDLDAPAGPPAMSPPVPVKQLQGATSPINTLQQFAPPSAPTRPERSKPVEPEEKKSIIEEWAMIEPEKRSVVTEPKRPEPKQPEPKRPETTQPVERDTQRITKPEPRRPAQPAVSGPLPTAAVQKSKGPLIVVGLGALALLAGGGYLFWQSQQPKTNETPASKPAELAETKPALEQDAGATAGVTAQPEHPAGKLDDAKDDPSLLMEVKKTAELYSEGGDTFVKVGNGAGLKPGQSVAVLGPSRQKDIYPLLGQAVVKQVFSKLTLLALDGAATSAPGPKWIALTPVKPWSAVAAANGEPAKTETPAARTLAGTAFLLSSNPKGPSVKVSNDGAGGWSKCVVTVPGQLSCALGSLAPRFTRELLLSQCKPDRAAPKLNNQVQVRCAEGTARFNAE
ncbi:MAG: protein kinase [Myxococcaceae bacterium]